MKKIKLLRLFMPFQLLALLAVVGWAAAQAPEAPEAVTGVTITPSSVVAGNSITVNVNFTVPDTTIANTICLYYLNTHFPFAPSVFGLPSSVTSTLGDLYTLTLGTTLGGGAGACPGVGVRWAVAFSISDPDDFADGGDDFSFTMTVPLTTTPGSKTLTFRQYNPTLLNTLNGSFTVLPTPSTIYVSNTAGCGSNSPCYTGPTALAQALTDISSGGTIFIYSTFSQGAGVTAQLTGSKSVTISGINTPLIENGGGTCTGAMIENAGSGTLEFTTVSLNGTCAAGARTAGILQSAATGTTIVRDSFNTISNFTGSGAAALRVTDGTLIVHGNSFQNNRRALHQTSGTLYAFANNVNSNIEANAASSSGGLNNVSCNYWGASTISGFNPQDFAERLGAPVVNYIEGTGALTLGNASLTVTTPITGTQVLINMGRTNHPFNNGTVIGLGARVSDYFAVCGTRTTATGGAITIIGDSVAPGPNGFHLHAIEDVTQCSPSTNTACWDDLSGGAPGSSCFTTGCSVSSFGAIIPPSTSMPRDGHYVVGNEMDPTAVNLLTVTLQGGNTAVWSASLLMALLLGITFVVLRRRRA